MRKIQKLPGLRRSKFSRPQLIGMCNNRSLPIIDANIIFDTSRFQQISDTIQILGKLGRLRVSIEYEIERIERLHNECDDSMMQLSMLIDDLNRQQVSCR